MKKTVFIKNAAILTTSSLILRFAGIMFKVWLAAKIGAEGIGLYQLIFSVYVLVSTFAGAGICTAVTRLISEEAALGSKSGVNRILIRCIELISAVAIISLIAVFVGADFIAGRLLGDMRASLSLKILGFSLPFMGISSCFKGYFISFRKATPPATAVILEQAVRIALVFVIIGRIGSLNLETACAAVLFGDTVAEAVSALYIFVLFLLDQKKLSWLSGRSRPPYPIVKQVLRISAPITLGRYLNSGLRTIENLLVPKTLSKFSGGGTALSQFGMIKGMALPLLFFPSALLNSISTLLIPEMSEAVACGRVATLKRSTEKTIKLTLYIGILFGAIFWGLGREIGGIVYKNDEVGFLTCALSPIVPLMYLDSIADGILKGLDEQLFCFKNSICDSSIRILLISLLLPRLGLYGFIGIMYFSNFFTCFLNVSRLLKVSGAKIKFLNEIVLPTVISLFSVIIFNSLISLLRLSPFMQVATVGGLSVASYFLLLSLLDIIELPRVTKRREKVKQNN